MSRRDARATTPPMRLPRIAALAAVAVTSLALAGLAAAAVTATAVARLVITPPRRRAEDIAILGSTATTITLSVTAETVLPGRYSLWFSRATGHAKLGEILVRTPTSVTRELVQVDRGDLRTATRGYLAGWIWLDPADLGVPYSDVSVETELGPAPAWLIPASEGRASVDWVIGVHGRGVKRSECLRAVGVFREAGYDSLLISYRNDGDAPPSADGRFALGDREWADVDSAIRFALDHGARRIVLMGWSMGGATVLQAAARTRHPAALVGLVLESPVVDWVTALDYQGAARRLPRALYPLIYGMLGSRRAGRLTGLDAPIDLPGLDFVRRADELWLPTLILHSVDDGFVPATASRALAAARPDLVTYEEFDVARHTKLWNYDPGRFERAIGEWLEIQRRGRRGGRRARPAAARRAS